ncbi:trigger factor [Imhoffiella purpurea]|uniref:Trigger factor n=1 Tax=Imhoffiella purpurea TaxID=1249627 RepID=W9VTG6_9GAMM|nr:trigger factor [Imhoffiella purpurea]EXJ13685.1 Cell division trigger factor [Imhoffiella purpurea]
MQVSVEAGEGLERRMKIDLPFEQIQTEVEKRLQQLARTARLPGFRPGKVPMKVLRKRYSDHVQQEVFSELVQSSFMEALSEQDFRPVGAPTIDPEIDVEGEKFGFTATFEVMPEVELASLDGKVVKKPVSEVTDADLEAMIERLRDQRKTWEAAERPCQTGDKLTISFTGTLDGEAFEGGSSEGFEIELGTSRMIPGFEDGLIGASAGEQRTLDLSFPESYQAEHLAGKPVRFEVTVDAVEEPKLPEIDADFVKGFGVEDGDIERFRSDVRGNMERELKQRLTARTKESVMDLLVESNAIDLPKALLESEMKSMAEQMRNALGGGKMELPHHLFESGARRRVALGLILGQIVKDRGLTADPDRVRQAIEQMAASYEDPQAVVNYYYGNKEMLSSFESLALEEQVVELILEEVAVEEENLTFEELTNPPAPSSEAA